MRFYCKSRNTMNTILIEVKGTKLVGNRGGCLKSGK